MRLPTWLGACAFLLAVFTLGRADEDKPKELPPAPEGFASKRDNIERGNVETVEYESKSVGTKRKMVVYTPPGYSKDKKYPVFYLLHGAGDNESGWTMKGSANIILDNLYADKKIAPMIVVMPNGSMQGPGRPGGGGLGNFVAPALMKQADTDKDGKLTEEELVAAIKKLFKEADKDSKGSINEKQLTDGLNKLLASSGSGRPGGGGFGGNREFENDLLKDIIPYVEKHYPVLADRDHRAMAGLSMGGGQALTIGLQHLDTFAWVGGFSSALFGNRNDLVSEDLAKKKLRLLWLSCGDKDSLMDGSKSFHTLLERQKVPHVWHVDSGAHTWPVWKNDLYLLAPMLFREQ